MPQMQQRVKRPAHVRAGTAAFVVVGVLLAAVVAGILATQSGALDADATGITDVGAFTRYGVVIARLVAELAAVVTVGSLLLASFLVPPQRSGTLAADGYAALRVAGAAAWCWVAAAVATAAFIGAEESLRPFTEMLNPRVFALVIDQADGPGSWLLSGFIALVLAVACRFVLSWGWTATLFVIAVAGLLPVAITGHSATGGAHDVATNSLLIHLIAAALWVGGLIALLALGRRGSKNLPLAVRRFSRLALCCWIAMAVSGVVNGLVRIAPADLLDSPYGLLVLAKITALAMLGVIGQQQRARGVRELVDGNRKGAFLQLAGVEVLVMFATFGIAAALAGTPPPGEGGASPSRTELLIGYDLDGPPTLVRLLFAWRFDLIYGTLAIALAVLYLAGVRRLRRRGDHWPVGRTVAWVAGCAGILVATSSGLGAYSPAMFSVHMGVHMLLSMLAPILLVLGGGMTLALRALPAAGKDDPPGPREWLLAALHSPVSRFFTHPLIALTLFVGSFYLLYFSGLFDVALTEHWAHLAMNAHFLAVGYMFFWPLIGIDPAPRQLMPLAKLGLMFAAMPFHAFFGVIVMGSRTAIGEQFYRQLDLSWVPDLVSEQRLGGGIAWAFGEIPALLVLVALMVQWARADERAGKRGDRKAARDENEELAAYNAMLAQLAKPRRRD